MEYIMNPTIPYLPPEMIDEILMNIEDGQDLINAIKALLLTPLYYNALIIDNYLWRHLIKEHYPFYNISPTENKLKTLLTLLNSFPNRLNKENWDIANAINNIDSPMVITYYFMKCDIGAECRTVDFKLIKKLFDTEYINNISVPESSFSKREILQNTISNTYHSCVYTNNVWAVLFRAFINKIFPTIGLALVDYIQSIPRRALDEEDPYLNALVNYTDEIQKILDSDAYHFYQINKIE